MTGAADKLPLVSIFCVCKDGHQTIRRCVESVLKQDYPNIEFVVQDGASTDGTLEILRGYNEVNAKIKLVSEPDSGSAEGFFRVLKRCSGEIIGSCLSDEELLPHAVSWAVNNFAKLPDMAAIYGDVYLIDAVGNTIGEFNAGSFDFARYLCHEIVPPFSASFFRRNFLEKIGLKERKWALDCGEFELWIRLGVNFQICHVSGFVSKFSVNSDSNTQKASTYFELIKGRLKVMDRFFSDPKIPQEIRQLRPRAFAGLHLWVSESLRNLNDMAEARRQIQKALKFEPNLERLAGEVRALCNYGWKLLQNGSIADSLDYFDLSQEANLCIQNVNYYRAVALVQLGRLEEAKIAAEAEIIINPEHVGAKKFLGKIAELIRARFIVPKSDEINYEQERADLTENKVFLSVIVTARNDNHGGNLVQRMQFFVNGLLSQSEKYKLATELVLVEWNPPLDKPRLVEALVWPKAHTFCTVRIIEVPHEIHYRYEHFQKLALYQMIAKNVGLRRARGRFCLATNIDIVFSDELFAFLASGKLAKGKMYRVNRYDVRENASPDLLYDDLLSFCRENIIRIYEKNGTESFETGSYHKVSAGLFTNACGDFQLMAREHWYTLRGYPEFDMFSFHLDSILEFMAYFSGIAEEILPDSMRIYHIDHSSGWSPEIHKDNILENRLKRDKIPQLSNEEFQKLCVEMAQKKRSFIFNDENWGLGSDKLNETVILSSKWDDKFQVEHSFIADSVVTERQKDFLPQESSAGKYLSIVVTARNDDHGDNMLHRMQTFINVLCHQCVKYGLNAELIIVEWNPPRDKERISQVVDWPNEIFPLSVRFIEVPPELHDQVKNADKIPLFQMIAKNAGIRRAIGKFVLATNIDIIFSDELMWFLSRKLLDEDSFYRISRYDVGSKIIPTDITVGEQLKFCRNNLIRIQGLNETRDIKKIETESEFHRQRDEFIKLSDDEIEALLKENGKENNLFTNACGDFTLMSRGKWLSFKCYPELPLGGMYIDGLVLHMSYVSGLRQFILPYPMRIYHIEHGRSDWSVAEEVEGQNIDCERKRPTLDYHRQYLPWCQKMLREKRPLNPNDDNWGLAQYKLKEFVVSGSVARTEMRGEIEGGTDTSDTFHEWITKLELTQNRLYYRDQSPESLKNLLKLVVKNKPTKIVELGTLSGLSLRTWLLADSEAEIIAIDMSMAPLRQSQQIIPVDLSKVKLLEQNILKTDFSRLWGSDDRVLLYIDAHDMPNVPVMDYVLQNAVPALPAASMVVVDDLWHSSTILEDKSARQFFENTVINDIDPLQCFQGYYAPYWKGGSFFGFREVIPLMQWVNRNKVKLMVPTDIKSIAFQPPVRTRCTSEYDSKKFGEFAGRIRYNPIETICGVMGKKISTPSDLFELIQKGVKHYANDELDLALKCFQKIAADHPFMAGSWHVQGVILSRLGKFAEAENALEKELQNQTFTPDTRQLLKDIRKRRQFLPLSKGKHGTAKVAGNPLTIFTVPKPFGGNNDIIQRNAIRSWTLIEPRAEIILLGNEQGTSKVADEFGLKHMPDVKCNAYGTPLLNSIIETARSSSQNDVMMYINTDIILSGEVMSAVKKTKQRFDKFLVIGQRWDVDIVDPISFQVPDIKMNLRKIAEHNGLLHSPSGIDYFIFRKSPWGDILPFAIGRTAWDGWLVFKALSSNVPVIDATESILAIHQNHDYSHAQGGYKGAWNGPEAILNQKLSGGYKSVRSVADASWSFFDGELGRSQCDYPDMANKQQSPHDFAQRLYQQSIYFLKKHKFERALSCIAEAQRNNGTIAGLSKILNLAKQGQKLSKLMGPQGPLNCCETYNFH